MARGVFGEIKRIGTKLDKVESVVGGSRRRSDGKDNFAKIWANLGVDDPGMSEGTEIGGGTKELGVSLVDNFGLDLDIFLPTKITIFNNFYQITTWCQIDGVVSGGD